MRVSLTPAIVCQDFDTVGAVAVQDRINASDISSLMLFIDRVQIELVAVFFQD